MISLIAAASENNVIGKGTQIPWRLPADMKYFKSITKGHVVVMGRKTFESLGKPLPDRINIVITRQGDFQPHGAMVVSTIQEALEKAEQYQDKEIFIIGGGEIYLQSLGIADRIYLTRIHRHFEGDVFFPELPASQWRVVSNEEHPEDAKNPHPFSFITYMRIK